MSSACTCHIDAESCDWCKIEGIKERANNATVGPWIWREPDDNSWSTEMPMILNDSGELILNFGDSEQYYPTEGVPPDDKDAQFIIHAREDIPYLLEYIKKQQQEIERIIGWCCTECDENFYLPKNSQTEQCLSVIHCPYCGGWGHTVLNTIPEKVK